MADLYQQAQAFREELLRAERRAASEMVRAYGAAWVRIQGELAKVTARIADLEMAGTDLPPAVVYQQLRLRTLLVQIEAEVAKFAEQAQLITGGATERATEMGATHAGRLVELVVPPGVSVSPAYDPTAPAVFSPTDVTLATGAAEQIAAMTQPAAPLGQLFATLGPDAARKASDVLVSGVIGGRNPRVIAAEMRGALGGNLTRALTIARTEVLRSYREASRATYAANANVLDGWVWTASLSTRTCAACLAQHGSVHPLTEIMATHPRCRCTMSPVVKPWSEIGGGRRTPETVDLGPTGPQWFRKQPAADQRAVLGDAKYQAFRAREITLPDLVATRYSPTWGPSSSEAGLAAAKEAAASRRAG